MDDDDGHQVMAIAQMALWARRAKKGEVISRLKRGDNQ